MRESFLPYNQAYIGEEEIASVTATLRSGWLTTGIKCQELEQLFGDFVGSNNTVAVNSCTSGLFLILTALGIGHGDEVIVPDITFCATANVVFHTGAQPKIVDVLRDSYLLDPAEFEKSITPKTKAVIAVHYGGQPCAMDTIVQIAKKHGIAVIEDAAHAVGTMYNGRHVGTFGVASAFSFYSTKNMTTAEGGMVVTQTSDLSDRVRRLALHGISKDAWKRYTKEGTWKYDVLDIGYKCNLTDLAAAIGIPQIQRLPWLLQERKKLAAYYTSSLQKVPGITPQLVSKDGVHSWHLYVIEVDADRTHILRDELIEECKKRNIGTSLHFIPLHTFTAYQNRFHFQTSDFPVATQIYDRILSLPLYPGMTFADVDDVVSALQEIIASRQ